MSQYINQMNININEIARLQFNEVIDDKQLPIFSTIICMQYEFLKEVYRVLGDSIKQHEKQLSEIKSNPKLS